MRRRMKKKTGLIYDSNGMIVGEIKDTDQGDSDIGQSMVDEWVEDDGYGGDGRCSSLSALFRD